jgi:hypothetical protein
MAAADKERRPPSVAALLLGVLGASAGFTFFLYVVGALLEFRRLQTLHLAAQDAVPELPQQALLVLAAHALLVPLALGAVASVVLVLLYAPMTRGLMIAAVAVVVLGCAVLIPFLGWRDRAAVVTSAAAGVAGWWLVARRRWGVGRAAATVFVAAALLGAAIAFVNAWRPPVHLACARLTLTHGGRLEGFYVGASSQDFFIAPGVGRRSVRRLAVVPRATVARLTLGKTIAVRDGGTRAPGRVSCR